MKGDTPNIPGEPKGEPELETDGYEVYAYGKEGAVPEDVMVVEYPHREDPDAPFMRMWAYMAVGGFAMRFSSFIRHRYGDGKEPPEDPEKPCCYMKIPGDDEQISERIDSGLSPEDCPDEVNTLVMKVTDAPAVLPRENGGDQGA